MAFCDNAAVVEVVNAGYSKDPLLMQLLRCLFFVWAQHEFSLRSEQIPGRQNIGADAISRDNLALFFSQVPRASKQPTVIPEALVDLVIQQQPDWLSPIWSRLFRTCLQQVSPQVQGKPMQRDQIDTGTSAP